MSRVAPRIDSNENDIDRLKSIVRNELSSPVLSKKAQAILKCMEGKENKVIAQELGVRENTIGDWRKKYIKNGIEGLKRKKRVGRGKNAALEPEELVREKFGEPARGECDHTVESLCKAAGTSEDTEHHTLWEEGLSLNTRNKDESECRHEAVMRNTETAMDVEKDTGDIEIRTKEEDLFSDPCRYL